MPDTPPTEVPLIVVTFVDGKIGRAGNVAPLTIPADRFADLPDLVEAYARRFLGSRGVDVGYWPEDGIGRVMVGGFRVVASFTLDQATADREVQAAAGRARPPAHLPVGDRAVARDAGPRRARHLLCAVRPRLRPRRALSGDRGRFGAAVAPDGLRALLPATPRGRRAADPGGEAAMTASASAGGHTPDGQNTTAKRRWLVHCSECHPELWRQSCETSGCVAGWPTGANEHDAPQPEDTERRAVHLAQAGAMASFADDLERHGEARAAAMADCLGAFYRQWADEPAVVPPEVPGWDAIVDSEPSPPPVAGGVPTNAELADRAKLRDPYSVVRGWLERHIGPPPIAWSGRREEWLDALAVNFIADPEIAVHQTPPVTGGGAAAAPADEVARIARSLRALAEHDEPVADDLRELADRVAALAARAVPPAQPQPTTTDNGLRQRVEAVINGLIDQHSLAVELNNRHSRQAYADAIRDLHRALDGHRG